MVNPAPSTSSAADAAAVERAGGHSGASLVSSSISQQGWFEIHPITDGKDRSVSIKRPGQGDPDQAPPDRSGSWIGSFSDASRRRLRRRAVNAFPALISQFCLTYHQEWPTDGRISKAHLNAWLTALRRIAPGVGYLWILEFQQKTRNAPHYHVFLTIHPDQETWSKLAEAWFRITGGTDDQLWFHGPKRGKNWISWDMRTGNYVCKYLDKEHQKSVPEGYQGFGRFWGNSRGLEAEPEKKTLDEVDQACSVVDQETGEIYGGISTVIRWLGRLAEKQTRGYSRFRTRAPHGSYTILQGAKAFRQIESYFHQLKEKEKKNVSSPGLRSKTRQVLFC